MAENDPESQASYTLLIVDDAPEFRVALVDVCQRAGFETLSAEGGHKALDLLRTYPVDGVISDIRMPSGDGIELLTKIKAIYPVKPFVILMSGFADVTEADALTKGAYALFNKPFSPKKMIGAIKAALEAQKDAQKNQSL